MDSNTLELYRALESGPYDEAGLSQVKRLLNAERRALRAKHDLKALEQLIPMLQQWAAAAGGGWLSASALGEAVEIAELDLRNTARAEELRTQVITTGRSASGTPIPLESSEHTQEVHTVDLEVGATPSMLPLADADVLSAEIAHAEHVLEADSSPERVRELADLYARRDADGDRENATQLYCTLAEMLGNPAGVPMLERALALIPDHAEAKALLMRYAVKPRRVSSPKITLLGVAPTRGVPQPPPPAAAGLSAPPKSPALTPGNPAPAAAGTTNLAEPIAPQPLLSVSGDAPATDASVSHPPLTAARRATPLSAASNLSLSPGLTPKTAAGAALSSAAARISSRPPAARSSRPPGRRSSTSPGYVTAASAAAIAAEDRAIPLETVAVESLPPLAVAAASLPQLSAAVAQDEADAHDSVAPVVVRELEPANDTHADTASTAIDEHEGPEVLQLHGIPQVKTAPPSVPEISSLSPSERSDITELEARRLLKKTKRAVITSGIAFGAVAALGIYLNLPNKGHEETLTPTAANTAAAKQPQAAAQPQPTATEPPAAKIQRPAQPAPEAKQKVAAAKIQPQPTAASAKLATVDKAEAPAPLAPPALSHQPTLKLEGAKLKGAKLNETQLAQALTKAEPKLLACYAKAIEDKPKTKGRVLYTFTIRPNGRATAVKRAGGTLKDDAMLDCSTKALEAIRFPKPKKNVQVKLPILYKRS